MAVALELDIVLDGLQPSIWRRIIVPAQIKLPELHDIVQTAMGWTDRHLHMFLHGDQRYTDAYAEIVGAAPEAEVAVGDLLTRKGDSLGYVYDLGDDWVHTIRVVETLAAADGKALPRCVDGARACPPEDCGGI